MSRVPLPFRDRFGSGQPVEDIVLQRLKPDRDIALDFSLAQFHPIKPPDDTGVQRLDLFSIEIALQCGLDDSGHGHAMPARLTPKLAQHGRRHTNVQAVRFLHQKPGSILSSATLNRPGFSGGSFS